MDEKASLRWDEKAGLRGMRYAPSGATCSRHKEKETNNAEASHHACDGKENSPRARAHDRSRSGRSLVVLLRVERTELRHEVIVAQAVA